MRQKIRPNLILMAVAIGILFSSMAQVFSDDPVPICDIAEITNGGQNGPLGTGLKLLAAGQLDKAQEAFEKRKFSAEYEMPVKTQGQWPAKQQGICVDTYILTVDPPTQAILFWSGRA